MAWLIHRITLLMMIPAILGAWSNSEDVRMDRSELRRGGGGKLHFHSKRHMPGPESSLVAPRKRHPLPTKPPRPRENRVEDRPPTNNLIKPLDDEDIDNDEVFTVAIGPPPIRPKLNKSIRKTTTKSQLDSSNQSKHDNSVATANVAVNLIKNVLSEIGKELLFKQMDENFIFGQYLGNAMKNMTKVMRLQMQHDIVDLIVKYEKLSSGDTTPPQEVKVEKKVAKVNETEDPWADFSTLAKIVGG